MNNFFKILIGIFCIIMMYLFYYTYIWKGTYIPNGGDFVKIQMLDNRVYFSIIPRSTTMSESYKEIFLDEEKKEIYIWYYKKFFSLAYYYIKSKDSISLTSKGVYKIYYKNEDNSLNFIQSIEYK